MSNPDLKIWEGVLSDLRGHHPALCRQWFETLEPVDLDSGVLRVRARSNIQRDYLQRQCAGAFTNSAQRVSGRLVSMQFLGPDDSLVRERPDRTPHGKPVPGRHEPASDNEAVPAPSERAPAGARRAGVVRSDGGLVINPDSSFEQFVVGPGNRLPHAAAVAIATSPGTAYNPFFVHGGVGLGKTHLLQAICIEIADKHPKLNIHYVSCDTFLTRFMEAVQAGQMLEFRNRFNDADVLIVDDIHFLAKRDQSQEEFFHVFNTLYPSGKQVVLSSDAGPEDIPDLEERLVSRFRWGLVAEIKPPDFETRVTIVKQKARMRGLQFDDAVCSTIADHVQSNIREIEGVIANLVIRSRVDDRPFDTSLVRECLGSPPAARPSTISIQFIMEVVCEYYTIKIADLLSRRKPRSIVLPRQVCMFMAREYTRHSLEEIGAFFGGRDHTTVMHGVRAVAAKENSDSDFKYALCEIRDRLAGRAGSIPPAR